MRRLFALCAPLTAAALAAGCGASSPGSDPPDADADASYASNGTFTMAIPSDLGAFDPYRSHTLWVHARWAYDSLVNLQPDGAIVSGLAQTWEADAHTATFTLHPGVTCSDGTPLTATQVATDLTHLGAPENQSPLYGTFIPTVPFTATGDDATRTVTITMESPFGFILNTIGLVPIVCATGFENPELLTSATSGTGPFVLSEVVPGQSYTFTVRDDYAWGPDGATTTAPGTPARVVLRVVPNETTAANLLASGEVNFAAVPGRDRERLEAQGLGTVDVPGSGGALLFNHRDGRPTADEAVRRALLQALDVEELVKVNTGGAGTASTGFVALEPKPCAGDTVAGQLPGHDVAAAEALLDQASWVRGADGVRRRDGVSLSLDLHYLTSESSYDKPTAELIAQEWQAIGVDVDLTADDPTGMTQVWFETGDYDVYLKAFGSNLPSQMVPYFSGPVPPDGMNFSGVDNADYERLVAEAATLAAPEACALWDQAEQALWRAVDVAPIANRHTAYFLRDAEAQSNGYLTPTPSSVRVLERP